MHLVLQSAGYSKDLLNSNLFNDAAADATVANSQFVKCLPSEIVHDQVMLQSGSV